VLALTGEGRSTWISCLALVRWDFVSQRLPVEESGPLSHAVVSLRVRSRLKGFPASIRDGAIRQTIGSQMFSVKTIFMSAVRAG